MDHKSESWYWLIDLANRRLELHREPRGDRYALVQLHGEDAELELPGAAKRVRMSQLLR
jgi:hypothetical protein